MSQQAPISRLPGWNFLAHLVLKILGARRQKGHAGLLEGIDQLTVLAKDQQRIADRSTEPSRRAMRSYKPEPDMGRESWNRLGCQG